MKLVYKNLTICSKAEGSIPVCDTTCVPQLQENLMNSTLQLYLLLDTIYAGYMQVTLQSARTVTIAMRLANIGKDFALLHRQYVYMLLFYVLYRWDIKQVMMEVDAKEQQLQENLVQLGFQRIEYEQEHPAIATRPLDLRRRYIICMYAILQHGESFISVSICVPMMRCVANMQP